MKKALNINKTIVTIIILRSFEIGAILIFIIFNGTIRRELDKNNNLNNENFLLLLILVSVIANSLFITKDVYHMIRERRQYDTIKESFDQLEKLNITLRAQRHDFMNHLQVVYGLIDMDEYASAKEYIEKVFNDIQKVNNVLKTSKPAVNALLQAKILFAEKRGINIKLNITSQLKELKVPDWEFCRVIGNIIDNAIYALLDTEGDKKIEVSISEDLKMYSFKIKNNGPQIDKKIIEKIFEPGFSTKGERGDGMGLAIIKEILEQYGGSIEVVSSEKETSFNGFVPK